MGTHTAIRKRFCLEAAEMVFKELNLCETYYDLDKAAMMINMVIPKTHDEAMEEAEELQRELPDEPGPPKGPSILDRLRESLGHDRKVSLTQTLEAAIERCKASRQGV